eukprot:TRINITY_DN95609_c0_g1_i1.p1 TRINITY_DN95609_c0_g1~~TRINITY_DN95609_c0_g1_i1.p1  ORF type:complete len:185 (+),score=34.41 TRINITY_DN95609_c0_g1_i1:1-555(+)
MTGEKFDPTKHSIPEDADEAKGTMPKPVFGPSRVMTLNETNFDAIVLDPSKLGVVKFFAPWCTHCKQLAPVFEELAREMEDKKHIVFGEVDATVNRMLGNRFLIRSYPTLMIFPKDDKAGIIYNKQRRTLGEMEHWVKEYDVDDQTEEHAEALKQHAGPPPPPAQGNAPPGTGTPTKTPEHDEL